VTQRGVENDFEARRRARATWPVRAHRLDEDPIDLLPESIPPGARLAMAWQLAVEAWTLSRGALPGYDRAHIPARLFRPPERPDDE